MTGKSANQSDSEELEALFDTLTSASARQLNSAETSKEPQAEHVYHASQHASDNQGEVINHIGHLTRKLHETLKQLGYDKHLETTLNAIPDARDRLTYIAQLTEQSAHRTLAAIDVAKPIQEDLSSKAQNLSEQWKQALENKMGLEDFKSLVHKTCHYLSDVPTQSQKTNEQLLEIMMAQEFQDLTGQVIAKVINMAKEMEVQLLEVLVEYSGIHANNNSAGLVNGPVINPKGRTDVVTNQAQVDELLESLGF